MGNENLPKKFSKMTLLFLFREVGIMKFFIFVLVRLRPCHVPISTLKLSNIGSGHNLDWRLLGDSCSISYGNRYRCFFEASNQNMSPFWLFCSEGVHLKYAIITLEPGFYNVCILQSSTCTQGINHPCTRRHRFLLHGYHNSP